MGYTTKQKQLNAYRVQGFLLDAIKTRSTHRRPEDHAQAKIDAAAKRERRRRRRLRDAVCEQFAAFDRIDLMSTADVFKRDGQSAFDYLVASGVVRA